MTLNMRIGREFRHEQKSQNANIKRSPKLLESAFASFIAIIIAFVLYYLEDIQKNSNGLVEKKRSDMLCRFLCLCHITFIFVLTAFDVS